MFEAGIPSKCGNSLCLIAADEAGHLNNTFWAHVRAVAQHVQTGKETVHLPCHVGGPTASDSRELGHLMFWIRCTQSTAAITKKLYREDFRELSDKGDMDVIWSPLSWDSSLDISCLLFFFFLRKSPLSLSLCISCPFTLNVKHIKNYSM